MEGVGCEPDGYRKRGGGGKLLILLEFVIGVSESVVSNVHIIK